PAPARTEVRRRAHGVVPVLPAPCSRGRAQAWRIPDRRGLARGVDALVLAAVCRSRRGRARLARATRVPPHLAERVLLLAPARRPSACGGHRGHASRRPICGSSTTCAAAPCARGRRVRRAPSPR